MASGMNYAALVHLMDPLEWPDHTPVIRMRTMHFQKQRDYSDLLRHVIGLVTDTLLQAGAGGAPTGAQALFDMHIDMDSTSFGQVDVLFLKRLVNLMIEAFPDRMRRCDIHNAPSYVKGIYKIIAGTLPPETRAKIRIVKGVAATPIAEGDGDQ